MEINKNKPETSLNEYDSPVIRVMALMPRNICTNASGNGSHEGVIEDPEDPELWN